MRPKYRLHKCTGMTGAKGKFWPKMESAGVVDTKTVVEEAVEMMGTRLSPYMVEAVVSGVLESMIEKTLKDGQTRRFGDYFELSVEVKGVFDEEDEQFDPEKHKLRLRLKPLKRLREGLKTGTPENEKKPPRAYIEAVRSETGALNELKKGEDIIITGRNLKLVNEEEGVHLDFWKGEHRFGMSASAEYLKENSDTQLVVDGDDFWDEDAMGAAAGTPVDVRIRSAGGKKGGIIRMVPYGDTAKMAEKGGKA